MQIYSTTSVKSTLEQGILLYSYNLSDLHRALRAQLLAKETTVYARIVLRYTDKQELRRSLRSLEHIRKQYLDRLPLALLCILRLLLALLR